MDGRGTRSRPLHGAVLFFPVVVAFPSLLWLVLLISLCCFFVYLFPPRLPVSGTVTYNGQPNAADNLAFYLTKLDDANTTAALLERATHTGNLPIDNNGATGGLTNTDFIEHAGVTGLVLTKLDGSAKCGFVLAVQEKTGIPIKLVGQGEGIGDLTGFTPHVFAQQLVG